MHCMRGRMGLSLSWSNNKLFERIPQSFDRIAGFRSFTSMLLYRVLVTVWPFSWKCTNIGPLTSQKIGHREFRSRSLCLEFFAGRRRRVLSLHRLSLTLWFIMVLYIPNDRLSMLNCKTMSFDEERIPDRPNTDWVFDRGTERAEWRDFCTWWSDRPHSLKR